MLKRKWLYFAILWATHQKWSIFNFFLYFTLPRHQKGEEVLPGLGSIFERLQIILQSYFMPAFFPLDMLHDSLETDSTSVLATADLIAQGKQVLPFSCKLLLSFILQYTRPAAQTVSMETFYRKCFVWLMHLQILRTFAGRGVMGITHL